MSWISSSESGPVRIYEGINNIVGSANYGNEDLAIEGTIFIGAANFQNLVVIASPSHSTTGQAHRRKTT